MCKKRKKDYTALIRIEQLLYLIFSIIWYASISSSALLVGINIDIISFAVGLEICAITAVSRK